MGKLPFIVDGNTQVADSEAIIAHLSAAHGIDLDKSLSLEQKAVARAFERMLSEHTYWGLLYARWIAPAGWAQTNPTFFGKLPLPLRLFVPNLVRKQTIRAAHGHGLGRHAPEKIYARIEQDLKALVDYLGDKPYLMGAEPTTVDATVYGFICNFHRANLKTPITQMVVRHPTLVAYSDRMTQRYFPNLNKQKN
jgi:glutathione S-transferase